MQIITWNIYCKTTINGTAPHAVTGKVFTKALGKGLRRPTFLPVPAFVLKKVLGEMSQIALGSQRVEPRELIKNGFQFQYPTIDCAIDEICKRTVPARKKPQPIQ